MTTLIFLSACVVHVIGYAALAKERRRQSGGFCWYDLILLGAVLHLAAALLHAR